MLIRPLSLVTEFLNTLDQSLQTSKPGAKLTHQQKAGLTLIMVGIIVTGMLNWVAFGRRSVVLPNPVKSMIGYLDTVSLQEHGAIEEYVRTNGDEVLRLLLQEYSDGIRKRIATEVIGRSYDRAVHHYCQTCAGFVGKRQAMQLAKDVSQDFEAFYTQHTQDVELTEDLLIRLQERPLIRARTNLNNK